MHYLASHLKTSFKHLAKLDSGQLKSLQVVLLTFVSVKYPITLKQRNNAFHSLHKGLENRLNLLGPAQMLHEFHKHCRALVSTLVFVQINFECLLSYDNKLLDVC